LKYLLRTSAYPWQVALQQRLLPFWLIGQRSDAVLKEGKRRKNKQPTFCPLETIHLKIAYFLSITP
jgi:hypothetical protein